MSKPETYILHLGESGEGKALPLGLEKFPTYNSEGDPIHYRRVLVAKCRPWFHRGTGEEFNITRERADEWIKNVTALAAAGVKPYITTKHPFDDKGNFVTPDARDTLGYVERVLRDGENVFADCGLHGDDSLKIVAKNSRSIGVIKSDVKDAAGKTYQGETFHHLGIVPNAALPDLGGTIPIAASADIYTLNAAPSRKGVHMKPELAKQVRERLGLGTIADEDQLIDKTAEKALALSESVTALTTERDTLKARANKAEGERDAKAQEVLALSADTKEPDPISMALITKAFKNERDQVIASGVISEAGMQEIDKLLMSAGKPTKTALALSAGGMDPFYSRLCEIIRKNPGVKSNNAVPRDTVPVRLALDGDNADAGKLLAEGRKEAGDWQKSQQQSRGLATA